MVRAEYDSEAHAMAIYLVDDDEWQYAPTQEISDSVFVHRDTAGRLVEIEILNADATPDLEVEQASVVCDVSAAWVLAARDAALRAPDQIVHITFSHVMAA